MRSNHQLLKKYNNNISNNTDLSNYSWFNLWGPAEYFFKPKNNIQLIEFLKDNLKNKFKISILGAGSNTLIRDNGIKGVVVKLGMSFSEIYLVDKNTISAGAAALDRKISDFAKKNNIGNLEFLACIPGSIGGAVIMNSGCYGYDISKVLESINVIDIDECVEKEIKREEIDFYYRGTNLPKNLIITSAKLKGIIENSEVIEKKQKKLIEQKKISQQVKLRLRNTFKNISNEKKAWQIIKKQVVIN